MTIDTNGKCKECNTLIVQKWIQDGYSEPCVLYRTAKKPTKFIEKCPNCKLNLNDTFKADAEKKPKKTFPTTFRAPYPHESATNNGCYTAPVAGYLAKVTIPAANCKKYKYPFKHGDTVFIFGDIAHMPEHCVLATRDGKVHWGYHTEDFKKLGDEEV